MNGLKCDLKALEQEKNREQNTNSLFIRVGSLGVKESRKMSRTISAY